MLRKAERQRLIFLFLFFVGAIVNSLSADLVFAESCVKLSKVDHKIVEDRSSYFMIRFMGKIVNDRGDNLNGSAEFVIADQDNNPVKNIPGDILLNVLPGETYKVDQTFPVFKKNYKKGYKVYIDFYKKQNR